MLVLHLIIILWFLFAFAPSRSFFRITLWHTGSSGSSRYLTGVKIHTHYMYAGLSHPIESIVSKPLIPWPSDCKFCEFFTQIFILFMIKRNWIWNQAYQNIKTCAKNIYLSLIRNISSWSIPSTLITRRAVTIPQSDINIRPAIFRARHPLPPLTGR